MAEVEFEVVVRDGEVAVMLFDDEDDIEVITLGTEAAWALAGAIADAATEIEEST